MDPQSTKKSVADFYDQFSEKQLKTGINSRHRSILKKLKAAGLKPNHNVLEIGCGVGTLTHLLGGYVTNKITAADISPESIEVAKKFNKKYSQITYVVSDMSDFTWKDKFDFIVLPDVLEHIPVEQHKNLFKVLRSVMHQDSQICIHIPHPYYIEWVRKNEPSKLQVIDQPLYTNELLNNVYENDLYLHSLLSYSLSKEPEDYQWIILKPQKKEIVYTELSSLRKIKNKYLP